MTQKSEVGRVGEAIAVEYLKKQGWRIVERNHWQTFGELDIVCQDLEQTLVFVEVKTLKQFGNDFDNVKQIVPEDQMTKSKYLKTAKIAAAYAGFNPRLIVENRGWRIDLIAITLFENDAKIKHYKNISI
jgi:putative endonuclease